MAAPTTRDGNVLSAQLRLAGRLDERFFALLQAIDDTGSIHAAAATAGLSYKGARLMLAAAGNLVHEPLLACATGGKGGGGSRLTPATRGLLQAWNALQADLDLFLRAQEEKLSRHPAIAGLLGKPPSSGLAR